MTYHQHRSQRIEHPFDLTTVISEAQSGEIINVKVVGTKDYDLLVEQFYLIHNKKKPLRTSTQRPTRKETYMHPP